MNTSELLADKGIAHAAIIDDAYDKVPTSGDLSLDIEAWETFFADLGEAELLIKRVYPQFDDFDARALSDSNEFVAAVWGIREQLPGELRDPLFGAYELATRRDTSFLQALQEKLLALGLQVSTIGRTSTGIDPQVGVVFIDLFLGAAQQDVDMERSIKLLRTILKDRRANPPFVVLMSRSGALSEKRAQFRDEAELIGALFRVYQKSELQVDDKLDRLLAGFARHRIDALRVAAFLSSWETGLQQAATRFLSDLRKLDLSDYAQIRDLLLNFEGQPCWRLLKTDHPCSLKTDQGRKPMQVLLGCG